MSRPDEILTTVLVACGIVIAIPFVLAAWLLLLLAVIPIELWNLLKRFWK